MGDGGWVGKDIFSVCRQPAVVNRSLFCEGAKLEISGEFNFQICGIALLQGSREKVPCIFRGIKTV